MNVKYIEVFGGSQIVIKQVRNSMHCISNCMGNFQHEVRSLIKEFKVFNIKSIPRTCDISTDMFKHNVSIEHHSDLRGTLGRTWTYEVVNEDTKCEALNWVN
jgi:hypothetical protein